MTNMFLKAEVRRIQVSFYSLWDKGARRPWKCHFSIESLGRLSFLNRD